MVSHPAGASGVPGAYQVALEQGVLKGLVHGDWESKTKTRTKPAVSPDWIYD
jgi:hypothetical protein